MLKNNVTQGLLQAIERSPAGIAGLDVLESLGLADAATLRTTLSRLGRGGRIVHLKRGTYSTIPIRDAYACAQALFNGYLGFSTALYLHKLIAEVPFTITVVTTAASETKKVGEYEFRAVALGEKAVGFERRGDYVVSTRAKTLFDCVYLPEYAVERRKLVEAFREARLAAREWKEFRLYVAKFASQTGRTKMLAVEKEIRGGKYG
ncbi:Uncharacterised protein [Candidatus Burarchaeum australiense]|nr:Uncharacterised protein [Candidatus Burarchaeum australiense]